MKRRTWAPWLAGPALAYLAVFGLLPTAIVAVYSVLERDFYGQAHAQFSTAAWRQATDLITLRILGRSVLLALGVMLADLLVGYPCAMALARLGISWRRALVALVTFPLVTSLLLRIYGWMNLLPLEWKGTLSGVGLVLAVNYLPFMLLPLLRSFERAEANLLEAAQDLGATPWQAFWRVSWPLTRPGRWAGCALVFIPACGEYLVPHFVGQGQVTVIGTLIVQEFTERRNWPYAAACAMWLAGLILLPAALALVVRAPGDLARGGARDA